MPDTILWIFISIVLLSYPIYRVGLYFWERVFLSPEERWQRRYDRRMKNFFKKYN